MAKKKKITEKEAIRWVAENLDKEVKKDNAPSSISWNLLQDVQSGGMDRREFWAMWAKLLPTKAQMEQEDESESDAGRVEEWIDEFTRAIQPDSTEGVIGEPEIPEENLTPWGLRRKVGGKDKESM